MSEANGGGTAEALAAILATKPASCSQLYHHQARHPGRELEQ